MTESHPRLDPVREFGEESRATFAEERRARKPHLARRPAPARGTGPVDSRVARRRSTRLTRQGLPTSVRADSAYRRDDLESALRTHLIERLFDRCVRDIASAREAIEARDIARKAAAIDRAMQIVLELKVSLDVEAAPELRANLAALYNFVIHRLSDANATQELPPLAQATRIMTELGDAFRGAAAR